MERKEYPIYVVDAFTDKLFGGNPAAVCPLETWLPDELMQQLAAENNLSETVFFVPEADGFNIRWFTPGTEVKLCGHATLASAHVLFSILNYHSDKIIFYSIYINEFLVYYSYFISNVSNLFFSLKESFIKFFYNLIFGHFFKTEKF
jgi:PhzF family phenazine biosynthesis protein